MIGPFLLSRNLRFCGCDFGIIFRGLRFLRSRFQFFSSCDRTSLYPSVCLCMSFNVFKEPFIFVFDRERRGGAHAWRPREHWVWLGNNMAGVARSWCGFAKLKGVSRTVGRLYFSTDLTKTDRLIERVKRFVFGEKAPPEEKETVERFVNEVAQIQRTFELNCSENILRLEPNSGIFISLVCCFIFKAILPVFHKHN